ncbi:MAG TPA: FemAB family XrtA/PEP-CTERM system-associated protein [Gemmataceae bacterium]|nr:FemAB family XrtA/PEP-CTERM system-associated protein [Gemmataceae bacterium]
MTALVLRPNAAPLGAKLEIRTHAADLARHLPRLAEYLRGRLPLSRHPGWLPALRQGLRHPVYCLEAVEAGKTVGILPLADVRSLLFGRFLVTLPYLNSGGPVTESGAAAAALIDRAVALADELDVRYLELRNERAFEHPALGHRNTTKRHMRLPLPGAAEELWRQLPAKVRNQVRKAEKGGLAVAWGGQELLPEFYAVFAHNMRDLGTPVYGRRLFRAALDAFPGRAEVCVVRAGRRAVAAALLLHGRGVSEVPSASSLRRYNHTNANMLLYWHLLVRAVERRQEVFDFGRSSEDSSTYRFKRQWGATPYPAEWQYYLRAGGAPDLRPDNPRYRRLIAVWKRLPVALTRWVGPPIVRGIP